MRSHFRRSRHTLNTHRQTGAGTKQKGNKEENTHRASLQYKRIGVRAPRIRRTHGAATLPYVALTWIARGGGPS